MSTSLPTFEAFLSKMTQRRGLFGGGRGGRSREVGLEPRGGGRVIVYGKGAGAEFGVGVGCGILWV